MVSNPKYFIPRKKEPETLQETFREEWGSVTAERFPFPTSHPLSRRPCCILCLQLKRFNQINLIVFPIDATSDCTASRMRKVECGNGAAAHVSSIKGSLEGSGRESRPPRPLIFDFAGALPAHYPPAAGRSQPAAALKLRTHR